MPQPDDTRAKLAQLLQLAAELQEELDAAGKVPEVKGKWKVTARPPKGRDGGFWQLRLYPPGGGPSKQQSARPARTEEAALAVARAKEAELNGCGLSLEAVQERHLEHLKATGAKRNTIACHRTALTRVGRRLGARPVSSVALAELRDELLREGLVAKTVNNYLSFASLAWRWGRERELVAEDWPKLERVRETPTELRPCSPAESSALLEYFAARKKKWAWEGPYFALLAAAGSRVTETMHLRSEDVDVERGEVRFRACESKTDAHRLAVVPRDVLEALPQVRGRLWPHLAYHHVQRAWGRALRALDLEGEPIKPHSLRRSFITDSFEASIPLPHIMAQVGHVNAQTTLAYQVRATRRDLGASADRLATYRREATTPTPPPGFRGGVSVDSHATQGTPATEATQRSSRGWCSSAWEPLRASSLILRALRAVLHNGTPTELLEALRDPALRRQLYDFLDLIDDDE